MHRFSNTAGPVRPERHYRVPPLERSILAFGALCILACAPADQSSELEERRAQVAATGAQVMPFDLDATTHVFEKTEFGGIQQVVADAADPRQVGLIREHFEMEAERFARGDFHDPAMIHGEHMAGLHQLVGRDPCMVRRATAGPRRSREWSPAVAADVSARIRRICPTGMCAAGGTSWKSSPASS